MPNWCMNKLSVFGPEDVMARFVGQMEGASLDVESGLLSTFVVPPYNEAKDNWYWANIEYWGTKWDVPYKDVDGTFDRVVVDGQSSISLRFETAWDTPVAWFREVVCLFPELCFEMLFQEDGMQFAGAVVGKRGVSACESFDISYPLEEDSVPGDDDWLAMDMWIEEELMAATSRAEEAVENELRQRENALSMVQVEEEG